MEGSYKIIIRSQLGPKSGVFVFSQLKNNLVVKFDFLGHENRLSGKERVGGFTIKGEITTPLGLRKCKISGNVFSDNIEAKMFLESETYLLTGVKFDDNLKGEK